MGKKIGKNAPCPCGSGIKYKRCCLSKAPLAIPQPKKKKRPNLKNDPRSLKKLVKDRLSEFEGEVFQKVPGQQSESGDFTKYHGYTKKVDVKAHVIGKTEPICICIACSQFEGLFPPGVEVNPNNWLIMAVNDEGVGMGGPYAELEEAFDFAREEFGAWYWLSEFGPGGVSERIWKSE